MTVAILSLGTELTRGELVNQNATWLAQKLTELGLEVTEILTIDDDDQRIEKALERLSEKHDAIVSTGGLGPTTDDRTTACVANLLGVPLQTDEESLLHIKGLFAKHGVPFAASNAKQAEFPRGATILPNARGSAPGFSVLLGRCRAFFLPGVPAEMRRMFELSVVPALPQPTGRIFFRRLKTHGTPESRLGDLLAGLEERHQVTIGYRASVGEVEVKVFSRAKHAEEEEAAELRAEQCLEEMVRRLGSTVYALSDETLEQSLGRLLVERRLTLGLAESCTGGLVSQLITRHDGASAYYLGGICSYANQVKVGVLGVLPDTLERSGAVSEETAKEMALGAKRALGADFALALTGIAGPAGGSTEKPVGLVHWAVAGPQGLSTQQRVFRGERNQIQKRAALAGLWSVREAVLALA
jgi:nicotinamide-nucleotide amidase